MKYLIKIKEIKSTGELKSSWNQQDFIELLKRFDYPDAGKLKPNELEEYLFMAIADFDPPEAASIILDYKLSDELAQGQIDNISHEMLREKVSENYSDIALHKGLFEVNQLLYKAYNGKFPYTNAYVLSFSIQQISGDEQEISKEIVLKAISQGLSDSNLINRLFREQLDGNTPFPEAESIIWELQHHDIENYSITTSEKWITPDDFTSQEFESTVNLYDENSEAED
jgi:hypothetical protein